MAVLLLFFFPVCLSCNVNKAARNREKVIEDYVVSAKFDERKDLPQLGDQSQLGSIRTKAEDGAQEAKDGSVYLPVRGHEEFEHSDALDRDLLVHHHHLPPPAPPPPPPPPPVGLPSAPLFAIGFITFLVLLNNLYTSLLLSVKSKNSLLDSVTKPLGRKRRSASFQQEKENLERILR